MKVGIVGPISRDRMVSPDGKVVSKLGAVAYTVSALAKLLEGTTDCVVCLSHLSPEDINEARELLKHPNITMPFLDTSYNNGTEIELKLINDHERISHQTRTMTPVSSAELNLLADCDYLILMPLNETDIPLDCIKKLRETSRAEIFLDVHGLITGIDGNGNRYKKDWEHADEWLESINFLKMNDKEAQWAAGRLLDTQEDYAHYAAAMVSMGLSACWITFGDQSSLIAWRRNDRIFWANVPVVDFGKIVDTVGCGDSASAGFIYSYAKLHNPLLAVVLGNTFGSIKASISGIEEFPSKTEVRDVVNQHYRDYLHTMLDEFLTQEHVVVHEIKEDHIYESSLYSTDGHGHNHGADHACGSDS